MSGLTERVIAKSIKYGAVFAEVGSPIWFGDQQNVNTLQFDPIAKAAFGFASASFEVRADYWRIGWRDNA